MNIKSKNTILIIILLILVCSNLVSLSLILPKNDTKSPIGTYCTGNGISENDRYLVLQKDGSYVLYKQFELIEKGNYWSNDSSIYSLIPESDSLEHSIVYNTDTIYFFDSYRGVIIYTKIDSVPTYINLPNFKETLPNPVDNQ